jgi:hypothetical protein
MKATTDDSNRTACQGTEPSDRLAGGAQSHFSARRRAGCLSPAAQAQLLRGAIGHAAVLSDTPEKWAATVALLKQHGVDPAGYDDFEKGRALAIAASGVEPLRECACEGDVNVR